LLPYKICDYTSQEIFQDPEHFLKVCAKVLGDNLTKSMSSLSMEFQTRGANKKSGHERKVLIPGPKDFNNV